jgi:hypothetical protein
MSNLRNECLSLSLKVANDKIEVAVLEKAFWSHGRLHVIVHHLRKAVVHRTFTDKQRHWNILFAKSNSRILIGLRAFNIRYVPR